MVVTGNNNYQFRRLDLRIPAGLLKPPLVCCKAWDPQPPPELTQAFIARLDRLGRSLYRASVLLPTTARYQFGAFVLLLMESSMNDFQSMLGMPINQHNANIGEDLVMRVGIPHKGGRLASHAFEMEYPSMVSANAFFNPKTGRFAVPDASDLQMLDFALDSAGFVAISNFQRKGVQKGMAGVFPWSYEAYIELASELSPSWWSQADLCVEPEVASNQTEIEYRINATATLLEGLLRVLYSWQSKLAGQMSPLSIANMLKPPVPVLQGWRSSDYLRSLDLMQEVWQRWEPWLAPPKLIGIGSVCRRDLHHPEFGLYAILSALEGRIPKGSKVHLFGVKGAALSQIKSLDWIHSVDSMAWDYGARINALRNGTSNSMEHRQKAMTAWMSGAAERINQKAGDQYRLGLFP